MSAEHWNARYSEAGFIYGTEPNDFLNSTFNAIPQGKVLMLGDGEGRNGVFLARQGYRITSVDYSSVGLEKAKHLARTHQVAIETTLCDLENFTIVPNSWQGIVSIFCHTLKPLRKKLHRAVVEGLVCGGVFLLEAYSPRQLQFGTGGPKQEELLMALDDVRQELDGLSFELAHENERHIAEGKYHTGKSSVIQIIARKL
ncbi:MAG: class I SAM-dependent methyltransferase [Chlorobiales bacterium]